MSIDSVGSIPHTNGQNKKSGKSGKGSKPRENGTVRAPDNGSLASARFDHSKKRFIRLGFEEIKDYARAMADTISKTHGKPDVIIYIRRGGMVIARFMSDMLRVKDLVGISASYYDDIGRPAAYVNVGEIPALKESERRRILLVDDIADTGKTLKRIKGEIEEATGAKVITCTILAKQKSVITPDFYGGIVDNDTWVVFDYEEKETRDSFMKSNNLEGLRFMDENFDHDHNG